MGSPGKRPRRVPQAALDLSPVARVLACVADLMLASRVSESLGSAGHRVEVVAAAPEAADCDLVVCDLEACDPAAIARLGHFSIGFYSHLDTGTRDRAVAAGIDLVIPRSRMARELPALVDRALAEG